MAKEQKFESPRFNSLFELEESVLRFWEEDKTYEKSLAKNPEGKLFSFYDGPPFITGTPHYATLLPSIAKDIIPRYQTMKGYRVRRRWGWDVHGLPAENQVEKQLGLKVKKDIESLGVDKFIAECRKYVGEVSDKWRWYIDHIGRWADMDNAYRTDNLQYMESTIWAFKELYEQELIYRGRRVSLYCPRCATPLSKFEVTMDDDSYRMVEDPAVTVAFQLQEEPNTYLLAWTTTPWTLPANMALAVDPQAEYVRSTDGNRVYILAHKLFESYQGDLGLTVEGYLKGKDLIDKEYVPLYDFSPVRGGGDYRVCGADFVSTEEGTGIVHIAPGFGEDDTKLGEREGLSIFETLNEEGHFTEALGEWAGLYYKAANPLIEADLEKRGLLVRSDTITHSYPHCYRCATPLIYKSQVAWYLRIDPLRERLLEANKQINWAPEHFGKGRFRHNLETAPDWSLSRTRYWGTPIPVWETEDGSERYVAGSVEEIEKLSGQKVTDLHRPAIDEVVLTLPSGKKAYRVKEILDVWFESGSMPYAQDHFPFENEGVFKKHYPTDFIIEYTGQLRGWFYYLHVLGNALFGGPAFKNVSVTGVLMGTDGRKMSKSYGNYPDPRSTIEKYGAESLRLYFMGSRIMHGEDLAISEAEIRDQSRLLGVLHNSFRYFLTYANLHQFSPEPDRRSTHVLDRWIELRLEEFMRDYAGGLDRLDFAASTKAIRPFVEDLSTWFIRRSRDRFVSGEKEALNTLHQVLLKFSVAVAPTLPFSAEVIYRSLSQKDQSVHLANYPSVDEVLINEQGDVLDLMNQVRLIASATHKLRAESGHSLRQPLRELMVEGFGGLANRPEFVEILRDEVNVQQVTFGAVMSDWSHAELPLGTVCLDIQLTEELREEGRLRELLRLIQDARKRAGLEVGEKAIMHYRSSDKDFLSLIAKRGSEIAEQASLSAIEPAESEANLLPIQGEEIELGFTKA